MKFGINYSEDAAALAAQGVITPDVFKCPAWPEMIDQLQGKFPLYIHFPLGVGAGIGDAIDGETKSPPDWRKFEKLLAQTGTPYLNLHLLSRRELGVEMADGEDDFNAEQVQEHMIRDVEAVTARFGKEMVILENGYDLGSAARSAAFYPETIRRVVEETGSGFLFDISHARMAALQLGMDYQEYIAGLPVDAIREIHITGIQVVDEYWMARAEASGMTREKMEKLIGPGGAWLPHGLLDHLPLTDEDWQVMEWAAQQLRSGVWQQPWVISLECGGVGPFWSATYTAEEMKEQVPRLQEIFSGI